jgi:hypothetical protein
MYFTTSAFYAALGTPMSKFFIAEKEEFNFAKIKVRQSKFG